MKKLPSLNGLRAISIILVLLSHLNIQQNQPWRLLPHYKLMAPFFLFISDGSLGVNIFFVISGFLITTLLLNEEKKNELSFSKFFIRRALRIFPAYYFLLLFYFILELYGKVSISNFSWITSLTYTKYFNYNSDFVTAHAWSLSVEENFYLIWPLIFIQTDLFRKRAMFVLFALTPFFRIYFYMHPNIVMGDLNLFTRMDSIAIGCICALYKDQVLQILNKNLKAWFFGSIICLVMLGIISAVVNKTAYFYCIIPLGQNLRSGTIGNICIAIILMYSIYGDKGNWFKLLNSRILIYLGTISYSIYLWQQYFFNKTDYWFNQFPQNIGLIFVAAILSYNFIEKPFLNLKKRFSAK